jgi:hypothetical protein
VPKILLSNPRHYPMLAPDEPNWGDDGDPRFDVPGQCESLVYEWRVADYDKDGNIGGVLLDYFREYPDVLRTMDLSLHRRRSPPGHACRIGLRQFLSMLLHANKLGAFGSTGPWGAYRDAAHRFTLDDILPVLRPETSAERAKR